MPPRPRRSRNSYFPSDCGGFVLMSRLPSRGKGHRITGGPVEAPRTGFEPVTYRLTAGRSTVELSRKMCMTALTNACSIHYVVAHRQYFLVEFPHPFICAAHRSATERQPERCTN